MKLLFVHEHFGAWAGAEANVYATATELQRRGHRLGILHGSSTGTGADGWHAVFSERFTLSTREPETTAREAIDLFQPDLLYLHKMSNLAVLEALVQAPAPVVRMVHDHDLYCMRSYKYHYFSREICHRRASPYCVFPCGAFLARNHGGGFPFKWVSYTSKQRELELNRRFQRLIVATHYMKMELARNGFDTARIEIHPPVPRARDTAPATRVNDQNLIIYSGQIVRGKGVDVLLEALAQVKAPFTCLIFGDGNHREYCAKLCQRLRLDDRVSFMGFVPQESLAMFYRDARLAVVSSVWPEPFGATGLEAMRHGVPVVAFDAGGISEWLMDGVNGYLAPWMDRAQFAARVEQLLCNRHLARQMGQRGQQMAAQQYNFAQYITNLEDLFARVAAAQPVSQRAPERPGAQPHWVS